MTKKKLFQRDIPVITLAFGIALLVPSSFNPNEIMSHLSGISLGFGVAWLLKFLIDYKKERGSKDEN